MYTVWRRCSPKKPSNIIKVFTHFRIFLWVTLFSLGVGGYSGTCHQPTNSPNHWNGHSAAPGIGGAAAGGEETEKAVDGEPPALPRNG